LEEKTHKKTSAKPIKTTEDIDPMLPFVQSLALAAVPLEIFKEKEKT